MVNTIGTANVLEAIRLLPNACVGIMVTTDKVYENPERGPAFEESDKLGGYDPYSASKATCEIVIDSYRNSFFNAQAFNTHKKSIASVRAGNVIGGGDFSKDRIIPDIVRSIQNKTAISLRNPEATRPWQHVLEPLGAYLLLAAHMHQKPEAFNEAFNFGPAIDDVLTVKEVTQLFLSAFGAQQHKIDIDLGQHVHEAKLLMLNSEKARLKINWAPKWKALVAIQQTAWWYANEQIAVRQRCAEQIINYFNL
jgi:CDP-glucose 4,6-dehydratase